MNDAIDTPNKGWGIAPGDAAGAIVSPVASFGPDVAPALRTDLRPDVHPAHGEFPGLTFDVVLDGRYQLAEQLGSGSSAAVYRGTDLLLGRSVAVKLFHPQTAEPATVARQRTEMLFLARLNHPNLVSIYDASMAVTAIDAVSLERQGNVFSYLVMEFIDGMSLAQHLPGVAMTSEETAQIGAAVANALAVVHTHGLIHRDVKPANILLPVNGTAKLTDFGIARMLNSAHLTVTAEVVGTPLYLSPEQARGDEVGPATDIYSLGLVLLECLTGNPEFLGTPMQSAMARLLRDPRLPATLPAPWPDLLRSMTSTVPSDRPTADTVAETLTSYLNTRDRSRTAITVTAPAASGPQRPVTPDAQQPVRVASVGAKAIGIRPSWLLAVVSWGFSVAVMTALLAWAGSVRGDDPAGPAGARDTSTRIIIIKPTTTQVAATFRVDAIAPPVVTAVATETPTTTETPTPVSTPHSESTIPISTTPTTTSLSTPPTTTSDSTTPTSTTPISRTPTMTAESTTPPTTTGESPTTRNVTQGADAQ